MFDKLLSKNTLVPIIVLSSLGALAACSGDAQKSPASPASPTTQAQPRWVNAVNYTYLPDGDVKVAIDTSTGPDVITMSCVGMASIAIGSKRQNKEWIEQNADLCYGGGPLDKSDEALLQELVNAPYFAQSSE